MGATAAAGGLSAADYARRLLDDLGAAPARAPACASEHPALAWARSGLMALTGEPDGPARMCPAPLPTCADGALAALASLAPSGAFDGLRGSQLLAERAAIAGYTRQGRIAPGGACRLLDARDGAIALNLAREDDWTLLPAWLEADVPANWQAVSGAVASRTMHDCVERGREIGLAVAPVAPPRTRPVAWADGFVHGQPLRPSVEPAGAAPGRDVSCAARALASRPQAAPAGALRGAAACHDPCRVLDLSSLWAGPLCSHLLQRCGADVVKLESTRRPDGARNGPRAFFDLLNAGKRSVALDLGGAGGRAQLRALIERADIVIEASRPRALRQLGIDAEALVRAHPHLTWISLTGYGRDEPQAQWIAYGDDAGVAAGLSYLMRVTAGMSVFVGDAIADPLAGLHAALAAWAGWNAGGGGLIPIALVDVVRHCIGWGAPAGAEGWVRRAEAWRGVVADAHIAAPSARTPAGEGPALGAHTDAVLAEWGVAC